jgi:hypothetical protein
MVIRGVKPLFKPFGSGHDTFDDWTANLLNEGFRNRKTFWTVIQKMLCSILRTYTLEILAENADGRANRLLNGT